MSTAGRKSGQVSDRPKSGRSPDLTARQRSRTGVSSATATPLRPLPLPHTGSGPPALDTTGSTPLPTAPSIMSPQLLTARAVADTLDVCTETVLRWIRNGELPAIRLPGGAVRILKAELYDWLQARATPARGVLATTTDAADFTRYLSEYDGSC